VIMPIADKSVKRRSVLERLLKLTTAKNQPQIGEIPDYTVFKS